MAIPEAGSLCNDQLLTYRVLKNHAHLAKEVEYTEKKSRRKFFCRRL